MEENKDEEEADTEKEKIRNRLTKMRRKERWLTMSKIRRRMTIERAGVKSKIRRSMSQRTERDTPGGQGNNNVDIDKVKDRANEEAETD